MTGAGAPEVTWLIPNGWIGSSKADSITDPAKKPTTLTVSCPTFTAPCGAIAGIELEVHDRAVVRPGLAVDREREPHAVAVGIAVPPHLGQLELGCLDGKHLGGLLSLHIYG